MDGTTAYLISCSDHYGHRLHVVDKQLQDMGYDTVYLTSDFDHSTKHAFDCDISGCVQLHVLPYYRNLSVRRIISHWQFAWKVYRHLEELDAEPEVIVALLPPNFLAHYLARYKKRHPAVKLVFDVFDLWPETFPSRKFEKVLAPVFSVWAWIRNHGLPMADWVMSECDYFRQRLGLGDERSSTLYLCLEPMDTKSDKVRLRENGLDLCYLGAINNVIGISGICDLIRKLTEAVPVTLHIIGDGERRQEFMDSAAEAGAEVIYHGIIYDPEQKQEIFNRCYFGLNVINDSACIGLTMKSVDYLRCGLPIISNVPADTADLIAQYRIGIQLEEYSAERILNLSVEENLQMRRNVAGLFNERFSETVVQQKCRNVLETILRG